MNWRRAGVAKIEPRTQEDTLSQAEVDQIKAHIDRQVGFARDQVLTALGVDKPAYAPSARTPEANAALAPARRSDVQAVLERLVSPAVPATGPAALSDADVQRIAAAVLNELSKRTAA